MVRRQEVRSSFIQWILTGPFPEKKEAFHWIEQGVQREDQEMRVHSSVRKQMSHGRPGKKPEMCFSDLTPAKGKVTSCKLMVFFHN